MRRTAYDDEYPTCERTSAALRIYPRSMLPADVSKALMLTPTLARTVGEFVPSALAGRGHRVARTRWELSSEECVTSKDLRRHLDWLLAQLQPASAALRALSARDDVQSAVHCSWWSAHGEGGPVLWPEQMQKLAELDLELSFEIMFFSDDEP